MIRAAPIRIIMNRPVGNEEKNEITLFKFPFLPFIMVSLHITRGKNTALFKMISVSFMSTIIDDDTLLQ